MTFMLTLITIVVVALVPYVGYRLFCKATGRKAWGEEFIPFGNSGDLRRALNTDLPQINTNGTQMLDDVIDVTGHAAGDTHIN